jgi:hypothetical protein
MPVSNFYRWSAAVALWVGLATTGWPQNPSDTTTSSWQPAKTRAFIVSVAQFQGRRVPSFSTDDRLDDRLVTVLEKRGVPRSQIVFLKDDRATTRNIQNQFAAFLGRSKPGETLFFYFGSHGGYDAKRGACWFVSFDETVPFTWVFDAIERGFKGSHAILTADCCHSGGIVELAPRRKSRIAYACLSSTHMHQTAWSGWRFMQCLIRGLEVSPLATRAGSEYIDLETLARYTEHYMAFAAEGKPCFTTTNGFDAKMRLAQVARRKKNPHLGRLVEVRSGGRWTRAEIVGVKGNTFKVHYTANTRTEADEWVAKGSVRSPVYERFRRGSRVELQGASSRKWFPGVVEKSWESLHFCRYDGSGPEHNEWFGPSRIRPSFDGPWVGKWKNDLGQGGKETLSLQVTKSDFLRGTWSGDIEMTAERLGKDTFVFEARTPKRFYRGVGRIAGLLLYLDYTAHGDRKPYAGWVTLQRDGAVESVQRDPPARFAGQWSGTYANSKGGVGEDTLRLAENAGKLSGDWSGLAVKGERLGNATLYLTAERGEIRYRLIGRLSEGQLILSYSATSKTTRYTGSSMLKR